MTKNDTNYTISNDPMQEYNPNDTYMDSTLANEVNNRYERDETEDYNEQYMMDYINNMDIKSFGQPKKYTFD